MIGFRCRGKCNLKFAAEKKLPACVLCVAERGAMGHVVHMREKIAVE
jgi:hypothetical protein